MELQGSVIAVFGAGHGIGAALVSVLQEKGATVTASAAHEAPGVSAVDVRDAKAVESFLASIVKENGKLDAVVNCAAIAGSMHELDQVSPEEFEDIFQVNVSGTFHVLRSALSIFKKQGSGTAVSVASRAGHRSHPTLVPYSASKAAVISLSQGAARELKDAKSDVLCVTVSPGGVDTRMREDLFGSKDSKAQQKPEFVAEVIAQVLDGSLSVAQGGDVIVSRGTVEVTGDS